MNSWSDKLSDNKNTTTMGRDPKTRVRFSHALITKNQKQKHNICLQNKILNQLVLNVLCCELLAVNKTDRLIEKTIAK